MAEGPPIPEVPPEPGPRPPPAPKKNGDDDVILEDIDVIESRRLERQRGAPGGASTLDDPRLWRRLGHYARPHVGSMLLAVGMSMLAAASKVGFVLLVKQILQPMFQESTRDERGLATLRLFQRLTSTAEGWLDQLLAGVRDVLAGVAWVIDWAQPLDRLRWAAVALVVLVLLEQINKYGQRLLMRAVALDVVRDMRLALFERLMTLSLRFFHANHSGKLLSRLTNDLNKLGNLMVDVMVNWLSDLFTVIGALWYVWSEGGLVVIIGLGMTIVSFVPVQQIGRRIRRREQKNQKSMSMVFQSLAESLSAQKIVKAFGAEQHEIQRFQSANDRFTDGRMRSAELQARTEPLVEVLGALGVAGFLYLGGRSVVEGNWEGSAFFAVVLALFQCVASLRRLSDTSTKFQGGLASADRVATLLYSKPEIVDAPDALALDGFRQGIAFEHVWFAHRELPVLRDINFVLPKGGTLALVGHTGSGKSTIGDLLPRFFDVDEGAVRVDGHDIRKLTMASLRRLVAIVTQETVLFQGTISSNIAYGIPKATPEAIEQAARAAHAHSFISQLPDGYQTAVSERGMTLSGGERQRIAIARALLRDAPILLLDEATSALDTRSEKIVQEAIETLKAGRTTIIIAHRLSTIRDADQILVLEKGRIIEQGDHDALMALDGTYAAMVRIQQARH